MNHYTRSHSCSRTASGTAKSCAGIYLKHAHMGLISRISFSRPSARVWISYSFPPLKGPIRDCDAAPAAQIPSKGFTPEWLGRHQKWPTPADWNVNWRQGLLGTALATRKNNLEGQLVCRRGLNWWLETIKHMYFLPHTLNARGHNFSNCLQYEWVSKARAPQNKLALPWAKLKTLIQEIIHQLRERRFSRVR